MEYGLTHTLLKGFISNSKEWPLVTLSDLTTQSNFSDKILHSYWQIIQHYFLQILFKSVET